jgi:bifunctional non-homologous end joining protein LigD
MFFEKGLLTMQAVKRKNAQQLICSPDDAIEILKNKGGLFEEVLTLKQQLPSLTPKKKSTTKPKELLRTYQEKRDFTKTTEPSSGKSKKGGQIFVIQKHNARRLHYDLRLEVDGVLKSWAVPKDPSVNPLEKRLAIQTEDHPFEYKDFEGEIPKSQYGAGTVEIRDKGIYQNISHKSKNIKASMPEALENGKVEIIFNGRIMKGKYALVRFKQENNKSDWLLIKKKEK